MTRTHSENVAALRAVLLARRQAKSPETASETAAEPEVETEALPPTIGGLERSIQVYEYGIYDILEGAEAGILTPKDAETIAYFEEMIADLKEAVAKIKAEAGGAPET